MIRRVLLLVFLASLLAIGLVLSQHRAEPRKVSGFIEADEIRLGSRVGGRVQTVHIREGDAIRHGDVLIELEPFDLQARLDEAAAVVAEKQAQYEEVKEGFRPEEIAQAKARHDQLAAELDKLRNGPRKQEITAAAKEVELAQAELELARQKHERTYALFRMNSATQEAMDEATAQLKVAEAKLDAKQQMLAVLREGTRPEDIAKAEAALAEAAAAWQLMQNGPRPQEIARAASALEAAKAARQAIELQMAELRITSPVAGVVEAFDLQTGDLVPANAPAVSILDFSNLWVRAYVPEDELDIQTGTSVLVTVDSVPERTFRATVRFVAKEAEFTPGNVQTPEKRSKQVFRIKVTLDEGLDVLRPGMAADVWLDGVVARHD